MLSSLAAPLEEHQFEKAPHPVGSASDAESENGVPLCTVNCYGGIGAAERGPEVREAIIPMLL